VVALLALDALQRGRVAERWVSHTRDVIEAGDAVRARLVDAETGERGYIITGRDEYLDPYYRSHEDVERSLALVQRLTSDNPEQQRRIAALADVVRARLALLDSVIAVRRTSGFEAARDIVQIGRGKTLMDSARSQLRQLQRAESELLTQREVEASRRRRLSAAIVVLGFLATLAVALGINRLLLRAARREERDAKVLATQNARLTEQATELEQQVEEAQALAEELEQTNEELRKRTSTAEATSEALEESERRFRRIFLDNPIPMWVFDRETLRFLDVNEAAIAHYGYNRDEFLAMTIRDIRPPDALPELEQSLALPTSAGTARRGTHRHRTRAGRVIDVEITTQDLESHGRPARLAISVDVTERQHLLRAEQLARSAAEAANQTKTDFLATMSHELRTPLNAIAGYAELMELGIHGPITDQQRESISRIQRSQRHLLSLINDVLNFAKLEAGRVEYHLTNIPVRAAVDDLEALILPQLRAKSLSFDRSACSDGRVVRADGEKLQQILLNLLSNAIKFTASGGAITLRCEESGDFVCIVVRDTGIGIAADRLYQVFSPFVQIDRRLNSGHEGTGLGLAISRDLARGMGGDVTVESTPGVGSTFSLLLPRGEAGDA
jgi:PAS domain S-box-containing protein